MKKRIRSRLVRCLTACLVAVSVGVTGCASHRDIPETAAPISSEEVSISSELRRVTDRDRLPFETKLLSDREEVELRDAFNALVASCALRYGVQLRLVRDDRESVDPSSRMWSGRFGTLPLDHARRYGYHASPGGSWRQSFNIFVREDEQPQSGVIWGAPAEPGDGPVTDSSGEQVPEGGCRVQAIDLIGGDPYQDVHPDMEAIRLASMRDPRTGAAMKRWGQCMADEGFHYGAIDEPVDQAFGQAPTDQERAIAMADVRCTRHSKWRDISFAIESALQTQVVNANAAYFESFASSRRAMLDAARTLTER